MITNQDFSGREVWCKDLLYMRFKEFSVGRSVCQKDFSQTTKRKVRDHGHILSAFAGNRTSCPFPFWCSCIATGQSKIGSCFIYNSAFFHIKLFPLFFPSFLLSFFSLPCF